MPEFRIQYPSVPPVTLSIDGPMGFRKSPYVNGDHDIVSVFSSEMRMRLAFEPIVRAAISSARARSVIVCRKLVCGRYSGASYGAGPIRRAGQVPGHSKRSRLLHFVHVPVERGSRDAHQFTNFLDRVLPRSIEVRDVCPALGVELLRPSSRSPTSTGSLEPCIGSLPNEGALEFRQ